MKKLFIAFCLFALPVQAEKAINSAGNFSVGMGPIGNLYLTDRHPEMDPGIGATFYFDYRWSTDLSTTTSVMMLDQDGTDSDKGQNSIVFIGIPTFDVKYYWINNPSRWDPYVSIGLGYYVVTHARRGAGMASAMGAQTGVGFDYYLSERLSFGIDTSWRWIALLGNGATGSYPLSLRGNIGFHF